MPTVNAGSNGNGQLISASVLPGTSGIAENMRIDGIRPTTVLTPSNPQEAADILADAAERGLAVAPVGGGASLALGNRPERLDLVLSTARLGGIIHYEPTDLTLVVGAGTRFADLRTVLAEHGQGLPLDVAMPEEATIGGLIATALAGPRRLGSGSLRDLLIGISAAHPSGTVTKAGGLVVKNVTGFDLMRLYHGSLGTLGVVVSANFKVLPLARAEATVVSRVDSLDAALAAAAAVRTSRLLPVALEAAWWDGEWETAVRLEGRPETVRLLVTEAQGLIGGDQATLLDNESASWWQRYVDAQAIGAEPSDVLLRCGTRPSGTAELARAVLRCLDEAGARMLSLAASPGFGSVVARVVVDDGTSAAVRSATLQQRLLAVADHVAILAAPPAWKQNVDVWGRPPETLDLMRTLKEQFDPARVLNPGRFAGHI